MTPRLLRYRSSRKWTAVVSILEGTRNSYGLGPVSVLPDFQRQGVGKALIKEGLSRWKQMNAPGCCLVGYPDYDRKLGFENMPGLVYEGVPQEFFFALSFDGHVPQGAVTVHKAFIAGRSGSWAFDGSKARGKPYD